MKSIYILLVMIGLSSCHKDSVICFTCDAPTLEYTFTSPTDTVRQIYNLFSAKDNLQTQVYESEGYKLVIDTDTIVKANFDICYDNLLYKNLIFPNAGQMYNRYCVEK